MPKSICLCGARLTELTRNMFRLRLGDCFLPTTTNNSNILALQAGRRGTMSRAFPTKTRQPLLFAEEYQQQYFVMFGGSAWRLL